MPRENRSRPGTRSQATSTLLAGSNSSVDAMMRELGVLERRVRRQRRARLRRDLLRAADRFELLDPEAAAVARWLAEGAGA